MNVLRCSRIMCFVVKTAKSVWKGLEMLEKLLYLSLWLEFSTLFISLCVDICTDMGRFMLKSLAQTHDLRDFFIPSLTNKKSLKNLLKTKLACKTAQYHGEFLQDNQFTKYLIKSSIKSSIIRSKTNS